MGFSDFFKWGRSTSPNVTVADTEIRSETVAGGVNVASWDSAFGVGHDADKLSIVYGCINIRAKTIASLPLKLLERLENGGNQPATEHPYFKLLTVCPNRRMTAFDFWYWAMVQLDTFGNVYIQKIRNEIGQVIELNPLNPVSGLVEVSLESNGMPVYRFTMANPLDPSNTFFKEMTADQIIHIKGFTQNSVYGLSPIRAFRQLYDQYSALETAGAGIARNAARPVGVILHPHNMKDDAVKVLRASWEESFRSGNSGKTAFLPSTLKLVEAPKGLSAVDAEYISQKTFTAQRIASDIFGIPLHMLGLNGGPTFASVEQLAIEFIRYTISPILLNIEQQLNKQLLEDDPDIYTKFDVKHLLRGDIQSRIQYYTFAYQNGIMSANEIRAAEDIALPLSPADGGPSYIRAVNYQKIDDTAKPVAPVTGSSAPVIHIHNSNASVDGTTPTSGSNNS